MSSFLMIKGKSPYKAVIGRLSLRASKAVTSIYHQAMKFPIAKGTRQVLENQYESRTTYMNAVHDYAEAQPQRNLRRENMMVLTKLLDADLEPRLDDDKLGTGPVKDLVDIQVDTGNPQKSSR